MSDHELAFVFITPHTLAKSRTGGVIARFMSRAGLPLVAARIIGPSRELVMRYAQIVREPGFYPTRVQEPIAQYIERNFSPHAGSGKKRRVMCLLFEGPDAVARIREVAGDPDRAWGGGNTVRGTYGDLITDAEGRITYFEPAVLVGPDVERAKRVLRLWAKHSPRDGGIVEGALDSPQGPDVESTLVMLKPDNFRFSSSRAGHILDVLSRSGLRIVAMKKFSMTVAQAEEFYGPVRPILREKFAEIIAGQLPQSMLDKFGFTPDADAALAAAKALGPQWGDHQFELLVEFMTGYRPATVKTRDKAKTGRESCIGIVYRGVNAVATIRKILGSTDPSKAELGSVRREFGSSIMVNAAHASDSVENAAREMRILHIEEDSIRPLVQRHYGLR